MDDFEKFWHDIEQFADYQEATLIEDNQEFFFEELEPLEFGERP